MKLSHLPTVAEHWQIIIFVHVIINHNVIRLEYFLPPLLEWYFIFISSVAGCTPPSRVDCIRTHQIEWKKIVIALKVCGSTYVVPTAKLPFFLSFSRGKSVNDCHSLFIVESNWIVCGWVNVCTDVCVCVFGCVRECLIGQKRDYRGLSWSEMNRVMSLRFPHSPIHRKTASKPTETHTSQTSLILVVLGRRT